MKNKKKLIGIIIIVITVCSVIGSTIYNNVKVKEKKANKGVDVLVLKEFIDTDLKEILKKISNNESFAVYVGYAGCQACTSYAPVLQRTQTENDLDTYYLNYKSVDKKSKDWKNFLKAIVVEQKLSVSIDGKDVTLDNKIGNILKDHGYTPVTLFFVKGKNTAGKIGQLTSDEINELKDISGI